MKIGLINNPRGPNAHQINAFRSLLTSIENITGFNHCGDRQDEVPHNLSAALDIPITIFPHSDNKWKFENAEYTEGKSLVQRNQALVDSSDIIIATPMVIFEYEDSPCWKTINYAISQSKELYIISPKGFILSLESVK